MIGSTPAAIAARMATIAAGNGLTVDADSTPTMHGIETRYRFRKAGRFASVATVAVHDKHGAYHLSIVGPDLRPLADLSNKRPDGRDPSPSGTVSPILHYLADELDEPMDRIAAIVAERAKA